MHFKPPKPQYLRSMSRSASVGVRLSRSRRNAVHIASMLSLSLCLRLNAILGQIEYDSSRQFAVQQVIVQRLGEEVVGQVIDGEYIIH